MDAIRQPLLRASIVTAAIVLIIGAAACSAEASPRTASASTGAVPTAPDAPFPGMTSPAVPSHFLPSDESASPVASGADAACDLLLSDELAVVVGNGTPTTMPSGGWAASQCAWSGANASFFLSVGTADSIEAFGDADAPDAEAKLIAYRDEYGGELVADIGDSAVLTSGGLAFRQDQTYVEITRLRMTDGQLLEVATIVAENLQQ